MNNINSRILLITLFLFSFSAFSQDSLAVKSKCDSLKAKYDAKLAAWKKVEILMKSNDLTKTRYDELLPAYNGLWKEACELQKKWFICKADTTKIKAISFEPPPQPLPPSPEYYDDSFDCNGVMTKPQLISISKTKFKNHIDSLYKNKIIPDNIKGVVVVKFILNKEGIPEDIDIYKNESGEFFLNEFAIEVTKYLRYIPSMCYETPKKVRMRQKIKFEPPKKESSKCDSLQAAYEEKLNEWKGMRNKMGKKDIPKSEYDSLIHIDLIKYNEIFKIRQEYCSCTGDSIDINREPPPPPPFVNKNENPFKIHTLLESGPELTKQSKSKIIEFLDKAYSGKGDKVSGEVTIKFVCTKEGTAHSMTINKEKPVDMGFGEAVIEAMKLAEFIPAKEKNGEAVNIRMALHFYFYNRENNRVEIK